MTTEYIIESSGDVFTDLGFTTEEANLLRLRAQLITELRMRISRRNWTHQQAAMQLGIEPAQLSDLIRGQEEQFSIDMLITLATRAGCRVELELLPA
ncbi:helix-turn-helix domain-containing protein [Chromatium okenii]|jgi:predicted XRE-type DNA-binding protein|uniref:Transcriptional regulator n=1 Tax=Chromatium okenii TaxID=61644 RepID=A0A2S7XUR5_9GAMM|nr:XRE family transcriptional regulator [Chromatium okenii]MBV5308553.1 XRE family transcriptional regulator [Chromatium okenii]PQJ97303.1 transcriptional regulator [Chromatium okenii]PQJ97487.1 transcriptional regulator [Chromatium okenii]